MIHTHLLLAASDNPVTNLANQFGVDWPLLLAQVFSFAVVAYLLYRFGFKPVIATMDERQKAI
ncbi:MAG TPA: ATP synthase F0 subunit B, partial [Opitutales bacterium]|nr:ATP synthase F0 subunit B [Opitutales bacterium]